MKTESIVGRLWSTFYLVFLLFFVSCSNDLESIEYVESESTTFIEDDVLMMQALGFDTSNIVDLESAYLIEGDILLEKDSPLLKQSRHAYHTTGLIGHPKQREITVGVDSSIPTSGEDNWRSEVQNAIDLWNPLSNLKMTYTMGANPDILIRSDSGSLPNNTIAAASWPTNGNPGASIKVNLDFDSNKTIPSSQKLYNMVHELGHCLGLRHTNWKIIGESEANYIQGTPETDPNSVMNGGTANSYWMGFSDGDKKAIEKLYPFF